MVRALRKSRGRLTLLAAVLTCACLLVIRPIPTKSASPAQLATNGAELTVERIYSAPSLSGRVLRDLVWSPDGKLLSYLDEAGNAGPELWAIDAASGQRHVLIDAQHLRDILLPPASRGQQTGLGRLAPTQYAWAPDSRALLLISEKELIWYELNTRSSRKLLSEPGSPIDDAKISPDGRWVSFLRNHDLWVVSTAKGEPRPLTRGGTEERRNGELDWVYPEELDLTTAYWWSPDSSRVALLQLDESPVAKYPLVDDLGTEAKLTEERYPLAGSANPNARVGVIPVSGGEMHWMDTGTDQTALLARVVWLADSRGVAIERLNRVQNHLDLLFADADSGKSRVALSEQDKYWVNLSDDLHFFADGQRFLWSSERSGFRHLYLYDIAGKQMAQLTHGDWEIEDTAEVDEKGGAIYFTSTEKSPIERQFYRVSISGGEPVPLTRDHGTHNIRLAPDHQHFLDTYSTAMTPPRQDLYKTDGSVVASVEVNQVAELDRYRFQPVEFLTVPADDGTPLDAALIKPAGFDNARKYPVIVYQYGGPHGQEVRDMWQGADFLWNELLAQKGFVIFILDNRGTAARGHNFETPIYHQFGRVELADQLAGVKWLAKQPYVDGARVGIWGWSFGGYMTCMAMLRAGNVFKAGFAGAPVTDWRRYDTIYTERYMGTPQENPNGYRDSSPVAYAAGLQGKLLIAHATGDDNVHFANTVALAEKLVQAQKYAEYQIYAGRGHGISDRAARVHIFNRATQFFMENLAK